MSVVKVAQCTIFTIAANLIAQNLVGGGVRLQAVVHAAVWGVLRGLFGVLWYAQLALYVPGRAPRDVLVKVALDQLFYTPLFSVVPRLLTLAVLEGRGARDGARDVRARLWPDLLVGWKLWPFVHAANFYVVPDAWQLLTLWSASLLYSTVIEHGALRRRQQRRPPPRAAPPGAAPEAASRPAARATDAPTPVRRNPPRKAKERAAAS